MQQALAGRLFAPQQSANQKAALTRLETLLALIEGWVDVVTAAAVAPPLPQAGALGEAIRRRRASGGPAEKTFAALVGLELRPRRLRDAANLFAALESSGGPAARDGAWAHPDMAPDSSDLDDPLGYVERQQASAAGRDDFEAELDAFLSGDSDGPDGGDAGSDGDRSAGA
jgi:putative hydrolase